MNLKMKNEKYIKFLTFFIITFCYYNCFIKKQLSLSGYFNKKSIEKI